MNNYVTGKLIKELREKKNLTQANLAMKLNVTDKAISKWETGRGFPEIGLLEDLAKALDVSVVELLNGESIINSNRSSNMLKASFYVCPICGNVVAASGDAFISCCGINLIKEEYEDSNIKVEIVENEYYVSINHEMTKSNYITFIAYVTSDRVNIVKLYPEQECSARFLRRGRGYIYYYSNIEGLYRIKL